MKTTDTSEKGLESLIVTALTGYRDDSTLTGGGVQDPSALYGGAGYVLGDPKDYNRDHAVDLAKLLAFLQTTQPRAGKPPPCRHGTSACGTVIPSGEVSLSRKERYADNQSLSNWTSPKMARHG